MATPLADQFLEHDSSDVVPLPDHFLERDPSFIVPEDIHIVEDLVDSPDYYAGDTQYNTSPINEERTTGVLHLSPNAISEMRNEGLALRHQASAFSTTSLNPNRTMVEFDQAALRHKPSTFSTTSLYPNRTAVELDELDPSGVKQLQRTTSKENYNASEVTLNVLEVGDGPFDLERFLRSLMKQYVASLPPNLYAQTHSSSTGWTRRRTSRLVNSV